MSEQGPIPFNSQQNVAIEKAVDWFDKINRKRGVIPYSEFCSRHKLSPDEKSTKLEFMRYVQKTGSRWRNDLVFYLFGYAGTGKTTIAQTIANRLNVVVEYLAPTGKAASRLAKKGCIGAMTVHRFAFVPLGTTDDGEPIFGPRLDPLTLPGVIVLDEGSMVGSREAEQLLSFGIPIIVLADPAQVGPVRGSATFIVDDPDVLLTQVERQGGDSNILRAATITRQGRMLPDREYADIQIRTGRASVAEIGAHSDVEGQIIVARNDTRRRLNTLVRKMRKFGGWLPEKGDKLIATSNDYEADVMNGTQWEVLSDTELSADIDPYEFSFVSKKHQREFDLTSGPRGYVELRSLDDPDRVSVFHINSDGFLTDDDEESVARRREAQRQKGGFDFGYAITVHKSQGSEWPRVLYVEESLPVCDPCTLRYTAITRAQESLLWYR